MARFMRAIQPEALPPLLRNDLGMDRPDKPGDDEQWRIGGLHPYGGGGAKTSRLPAWLAGLTTPSCSMRSMSEAARL
jgi:hypothetical protein